MTYNSQHAQIEDIRVRTFKRIRGIGTNSPSQSYISVPSTHNNSDQLSVPPTSRKHKRRRPDPRIISRTSTLVSPYSLALRLTASRTKQTYSSRSVAIPLQNTRSG